MTSETKSKINWGSFLLGLFMLLQQYNIININWTPNVPNNPTPPVVVDPNPPIVVPPVVVPDPVPPVVVPTPDPAPPIVPVPDPEPEPEPDIDDNEYPVPADLKAISDGIRTKLASCKNKEAAWVFAETYRVWSNTEEDIVGAVKSTGNFVSFNNQILKSALKENDLKNDVCVGLGPMIDKVIFYQLGDTPRDLTAEDDEVIKDIFRAISGQAYLAYKEIK